MLFPKHTLGFTKLQIGISCVQFMNIIFLVGHSLAINFNFGKLQYSRVFDAPAVDAMFTWINIIAIPISLYNTKFRT